MRVRLLLNENFPAPAVARLRQKGWDVLAVAEANHGLDDAGVLSLAAIENRWLVTFDRDYGELLFRRKLPAPPVVVLLRAPSYRPHEPADWIVRLVKELEARTGIFVVFDGSSIRTRPLIADGLK